MKRHWLVNALLLVAAAMLGAAAWEAAAIISRPVWPWLAWMRP